MREILREGATPRGMGREDVRAASEESLAQGRRMVGRGRERRGFGEMKRGAENRKKREREERRCLTGVCITLPETALDAKRETKEASSPCVGSRVEKGREGERRVQQQFPVQGPPSLSGGEKKKETTKRRKGKEKKIDEKPCARARPC
jgi:hypothetical protein